MGGKHTRTIYGLWYGGNGFPIPDSTDVETFDSLHDAMREFMLRAFGVGWFCYLDRPAADQRAEGSAVVRSPEDGGAFMLVYDEDPRPAFNRGGQPAPVWEIRFGLHHRAELTKPAARRVVPVEGYVGLPDMIAAEDDAGTPVQKRHTCALCRAWNAPGHETSEQHLHALYALHMAD